jgi:periplasmic protein TonB
MISTKEKESEDKKVRAEEMVLLAHEHMERLALRAKTEAGALSLTETPAVEESRSWDDIVFENRNQEYGAYTLRKGYANSVTIGFGTTLLILLMILLSGPIAAWLRGKDTSEVPVPRKLVYTELSAPPPIDKPKPPPPQIQLPRLQKVIKFVPPKVVKEQVVDEAPTIEEIKHNETSSVAVEGPVTVVFEEPVEEVIAADENEIFTVVEQDPQYPGGYDAMMTFVKQNMKYPANARRLNIEGTVYVGFVVNKDGSISDVKVLRGIMTECDNEAVRVIRMMPAWKPGKQNGRNVNVRYTVPLKFRMN